MPTYEKVIHEIVRKTNEKGEYLEIKIDGKNGEIWESKVFGEAVKEILIPGRYSIDYESRLVNGKKYLNIAGARLLPESKKDSVPKANHNQEPYFDRGKLINTCIMSAAEVYSGQGKANEDIIGLAKRFLDFAEKNLATGLI